MPCTIRILLAESQPLIRTAIRACLATEVDFRLLGEAVTITEMKSLCLHFEPDVLLLSAGIVESEIIQTLNLIHKKCPKIKVLVMVDDCCQDCRDALTTAGALGCILKSETPEAIISAIRNAVQGVSSLSRSVVASLLQQAKELPAPDTVTLTEREKAVLTLITQGLANKEIGAQLQISKRTVEFHVGNILAKLHVSSRVEAAVWATSYNLS